MTTNSIIGNNGRKIFLYRTYTANGSLSATQYLPPTKAKVGISQADVNISQNDLTYAIPISNGTVNDNGDNALTGSSGGDNTTDNTTTFKEGAAESDDTAQNLIANGTSASKIWTRSTLTNNISTSQPFAMWLYIKDATALAKFLTSGTALQVRLGSDASNYYYKNFTASELAVGWNWITSGTTLVSALSQTGTPTGSIDTFVIVITTNNSTDTFVAGDVVYDLLRQWATSDLITAYASGYPTMDLTNMQVTTRFELPVTAANGFLLDGAMTVNEDTSPLAFGLDKFASESKSSTDKLAFIAIDRVT